MCNISPLPFPFFLPLPFLFPSDKARHLFRVVSFLAREQISVLCLHSSFYNAQGMMRTTYLSVRLQQEK